MRRLIVALFFALPLAACGGAPPPCGTDGTYSGQQACTLITNAMVAKCGPGTTFDCAGFFAPSCTVSETFCDDGVDAFVANINAAASCMAAGQVTASLQCYQ